MDKKHSDRAANVKNLDVFFIERKPTKAPVFPALPPKIAVFHGIAVDIETLSANLVNLENSGKTSQKSAARDALVDMLHVIVPNLSSVANAGSNEGLKALTDRTDSEIASGRETELRDFANQVYIAAMANATALADYGDDAATLAQLRTLIDNFNTLIGETGDLPKEIITSRESLYAKFPAAEDALKDIDKAMKGYQTKDPDYYNEYVLLRPVRALGVRHKHPQQPTNTPQAVPAK